MSQHKGCDNFIQSTPSNVIISPANASNSIFTGILDASSTSNVAFPATSNISFGGTPFGNTLINAMPSGAIVIWSGTTSNIPSGWTICDGTQGTPNLSGSFIIGSGSGYTKGTTGGSNSLTLSTSNLPSHTHSGTTNTMNQNASHHHVFPMARVDGKGFRGDVGQFPPADGANLVGIYYTNYTNTDHLHTFTTDTGSGLTGTTISFKPVYYALIYIMKL
jgi:hypothetical protein